MSYYAMRWRESGDCATADPDLFFPRVGVTGGRQIAKARRICEVCRVQRQCLEFAMVNREAYGIWGGTTPEERSREWRKQATARRSAARPVHRAVPPTAA